MLVAFSVILFQLLALFYSFVLFLCFVFVFQGGQAKGGTEDRVFLRGL